MKIDFDVIEEQMQVLQGIKGTESMLLHHTESKGLAEIPIRDCKVVLNEIDSGMDELIDNTIQFLEDLKTAHQDIETGYHTDFTG